MQKTIVLLSLVVLISLQGCAPMILGGAAVVLAAEKGDCDRAQKEKTTMSKASCAAYKLKEPLIEKDKR